MRERHRRTAGCLALAVVLVSGGCSLRTMAAKAVADTLAEPGDVYSRDDDPELVEAAIPFALKTFETLLETLPEHEDLLLATCSSYTQYSYAFVQSDVDMLDPTDYEGITRLEDRAFKLYLRARDYCLRALDVRREGVSRALLRSPDTALDWAQSKDVPLLYWSGAAWGSAITLGLDKPELILDIPVVQALMHRALTLDETFNQGAIHTVMITLESKPEWGGSVAQARAHFARAVELSEGHDPGPYVTLATAVALPQRNREEFIQLLENALAIDPEDNPSNRLAIVITQARARQLLARVDELFPG